MCMRAFVCVCACVEWQDPKLCLVSRYSCLLVLQCGGSRDSGSVPDSVTGMRWHNLSEDFLHRGNCACHCHRRGSYILLRMSAMPSLSPCVPIQIGQLIHCIYLRGRTGIFFKMWNPSLQSYSTDSEYKLCYGVMLDRHKIVIPNLWL